MPHSKGLHHYHLRKRKDIPPTKLKRFFDKAVLIVGIITVLLSIPQITKIFLEKTAAGVSTVTWVTFLISAVFWFAYGIIHKEKPIIITYAGWIIIDLLVVIGILIYS